MNHTIYNVRGILTRWCVTQEGLQSAMELLTIIKEHTLRSLLLIVS